MFVRARLRSGQQNRPVRQAQPARQRFGNQIGLIVTAFPLPLTVERHWNHDVDAYGFAPRNLY
jgi:uncharacterized membrane protein